MTTRPPTLLAVLGHPIGHSLSPHMHGAAIAARGLSALYTAIDVPPTSLAAALHGVRALGFAGVNLTIPLKELAGSLVDHVTDDAARIGSINTIVNESGRLIGYNTDGIGWRMALEAETGERIRGTRIAILGAGGAARAIADAALVAGAHSITLYNRDLIRATRVKNHLLACHPQAHVHVRDFEGLSLRDIDILVQTTPVGMHGEQVGASPVPLDRLHAGLLVNDIVYRPRETRLLADARTVGARIHEGLHMLVYQGALAFQLWFGGEPPVDVMKMALIDALQDAKT